MPQTSAGPAQPPTPPTPPEAPSGAVAASPAAPGPATATAMPLSPEMAAFYRARRDALSRQLESAQERRDEVAEQLRDPETSAAEKPGLQERLQVLDERLVQIEKDIASNAQQLANAPASTRSETAAPPRGNDGIRFNGNLVTIFSFALLLPFAIQLSRRWFAPDRAASRREQADIAILRDRMDKMESSIDAVAIEVERIGEGQRFLTQAMVGGNLPAGAPAFEGVKVRAEEKAELR